MRYEDFSLIFVHYVDFTHQRNYELMIAFRRVLAQKNYFNVKKDFELVVNSPCSRFWVSEERATSVISAMIRDLPILDTMRPSKREMFQEIYNRVILLQTDTPDVSISDLVFLVVNSPAPKFYMSPKHASDIIYKIKRGLYFKHQPSSLSR